MSRADPFATLQLTTPTGRGVEGVRVLTLDRPERLNAMSLTLIDELHDVNRLRGSFGGCRLEFVVGEDESVSQLLADFDDARTQLRKVLIATDPDAETLAPPAPWRSEELPSHFDSRQTVILSSREPPRSGSP